MDEVIIMPWRWWGRKRRRKERDGSHGNEEPEDLEEGWSPSTPPSPDFIAPQGFERMFQELSEEIGRAFAEMFGERPQKITGFSMYVGPDGVPRFRRFGSRVTEEGSVFDVIDLGRYVEVIGDLGARDVEDVSVRVSVSGRRVSIRVKSRGTYEVVDLPAKVVRRPESLSVRNGVVDLLLRKAA